MARVNSTLAYPPHPRIDERPQSTPHGEEIRPTERTATTYSLASRYESPSINKTSIAVTYLFLSQLTVVISRLMAYYRKLAVLRMSPQA